MGFNESEKCDKSMLGILFSCYGEHKNSQRVSSFKDFSKKVTNLGV